MALCVCPRSSGGDFLHVINKMKINENIKNNPRDPGRRAAHIDIWAREKIKAAKLPKKEVCDYIPQIHNPEPMYRPGSQDAFRHPSLINGKHVPYWGYVQEAVA